MRYPILAVEMLVAASLAAPAEAGTLPAPSDTVLLTVTGAIGITNDDGAAKLDRAMLEAMPATTIRTTTIWTDGVQEFTGVSLHDFVAAMEIDGDATLHTIALNDYAVDIPASDAVEGGPVIAYENNGEPMSVRDKGPLWVVYPYNDTAAYRSEVIYSRSIWQLDRFHVR